MEPTSIMTDTHTALLALAAWSIFLVMSLGTLRVIVSITQGKAANTFAASGEDLEGLGKRLTRAHANCYEFLPLVGLVLLYAIATDQTAITNGGAMIFLGARIAQSLVHIASTSVVAVLIRFAFFGVQLFFVVSWLLGLAGLI